MRFWDKSLQLFKCLCNNATQSIRHLAPQTGLSKRSVHRLKRAMERRGRHPESWLWETEEGRRWFMRLVVATLYTFGLKRGVGVDTLRAFFARLRLDTQGGCSPCALRQVMQALEATAVKTAETWEQDATAAGEVREIIGGVDETFLARMMLVFQDLPTGYVVLEDIAADRTFATWKALVDARLKTLGTEVLYLVSDRAKALIQLAEHGLECLSMPDFFHGMHDLVKSYSLSIGQHLRRAQQEQTQAQEALARRQGLPHAEQAAPSGQGVDGSEASRGDALGRDAYDLSGLLGDPFAHAPSLPHHRLGSSDLCTGRTSSAGGS